MFRSAIFLKLYFIQHIIKITILNKPHEEKTSYSIQLSFREAKLSKVLFSYGYLLLTKPGLFEVSKS